MKNKFILIAAASVAMLLSQGKVSAQSQEYAYPHSIDLQTGYAASMIKVPGEQRNARGIADGTLISFRYTGYVIPNFGVFAELGLYNAFLNDERYFAIVNRADGLKYRYQDASYQPYYSSYSPIFKVGFASRLDVGQLSVRPRVGIGVASFKAEDNSYIRVDRMSGAEEHVHLKYYSQAKDYLVGESCSYRTPSLVLSGSLQATYTFYHHFYISAEAGLDLMPKHFTYEKTVSQVVHTSGSNGYNEWEEENYINPKTTSTSMSVPDLLTVKVGIGWNLGWNRNARRRW